MIDDFSDFKYLSFVSCSFEQIINIALFGIPDQKILPKRELVCLSAYFEYFYTDIYDKFFSVKSIVISTLDHGLTRLRIELSEGEIVVIMKKIVILDDSLAIVSFDRVRPGEIKFPAVSNFHSKDDGIE